MLEDLPLDIESDEDAELIVGDVDETTLREGARYLLVELLSAIAVLTVDALTPALHAILEEPLEAHGVHAVQPIGEGDT